MKTAFAAAGVYRTPLAVAALCLMAGAAAARNVTEGDAGYIQEIWGVHIIPFLYLGAKHMVTGHDHILFLLGVVFFLYKMKDVGALRQPLRHRPFDHDASGRLVWLGDQRLCHRRDHRPVGGLYKALDNRPATATSSAATALSRSEPRNFAVLWNEPSLLRTTPSPTSATQGR